MSNVLAHEKYFTLLDVAPSTLILIVISPFVGSFLGLLIVRLPLGKQFMLGRSECPACHHSLRWSNLLPIASWLWQRGMCRYCKASIGGVYPLVEVISVVVALWAATETKDIVLVATCCFGWTLLALSAIDIRHYLLPNKLNFCLALIGAVASCAFDSENLFGHLIGGLIGFSALAFISKAFWHIRGYDGLGMGDAKLFGALGMWVSWEGLPSIILITTALALTFTLIKTSIMQSISLRDRIPLGPFLAFGGWIVWLYGPIMS